MRSGLIGAIVALAWAGIAADPPADAAAHPRSTGAAAAYVPPGETPSSEPVLPSAPTPSRPAAVRPPPPAVYLRLEAGVGAGTGGRRFAVEPSGEESLAAFARLHGLLWGALSLAAFVEVNSWSRTPVDLGPGYSWLRWDFGLAPRYTLRPIAHRGQIVGFETYLALPFGLTTVSATIPPRRAFREEVRQSGGWFAGLSAGAAYSGWSRIVGVFIEVNYTRHAVGLTSTVTPSGEPSSVEHADASDHRMMLNIGGMLAVARSVPPARAERLDRSDSGEPALGEARDPADQRLRRTASTASFAQFSQ